MIALTFGYRRLYDELDALAELPELTATAPAPCVAHKPVPKPVLDDQPDCGTDDWIDPDREAEAAMWWAHEARP